MTTRAASPVRAAARGATYVADPVVAKIAVQGAREALRARGPDHAGNPAASPTPANARAEVAVHRQGQSGLGQAQVRVSVDLDYPTRIGDRCADIRRRVRERVEDLTGMTVGQVAVRVERLRGPQSSGGERVR